MLQACDTHSRTDLESQGNGPSCSIIVNQGPNDPGGWKVQLYARFPDPIATVAFVQEFTISARAVNAAACRVVAIVTMPGASAFSAAVLPPVPAPPERISVGLMGDHASAAAITLVSP